MSSLTESAAPDTAALYLQNHSVLSHLDKGHHRLHRIIGITHIHLDLFSDRGRNSFLRRGKAFDRSILVIGHLIKPRSIDSRNPGGPSQKFFSSEPKLFTFLIKIKQPSVLGLTLPDIEQVKEISDGLRIIGAGAAADHNRTILTAVRGVDGDPGKIQYLQDIGVAHFVLNRNP